MSLRREFVMLGLQEEVHRAELCGRLRVSRKTGYKWLRRFQEEDLRGLVNRPRRPEHSPRTQHGNNAEHNKREARLGCAHAHKLFEGIKVRLEDSREFPQCFDDYEVRCDWDEKTLPKGVRLRERHDIH